MKPNEYRFGPFVLRAAQRELLAAGEPQRLGGRAFDLLLALVERQGEALSRDELFARAWPGRVVSDDNLKVQVMGLRRLLGAEAIVTVPGHGYRFALPVHAAAARAEAASASHAAEAVGTSHDAAAQAPASAATAQAPANAATAQAPSAAFAARRDAQPLAPLRHAGAPPTALIGREDDLAQLQSLLGPGRLVTVSGAGGVGKTRLAQAALAAAGTRFADGAVLVELAPLTDPRALPAAVARRLQLPVETEGWQAAELAQAMTTLSLLLVLDNCEHLLPAAAEVAQVLLDAAPGVALLATSQEPLNLRAETLLRLEGLALPGADADAAEVAASPAVSLLAERVRALDRGFALDEGNAAAARRLVQQLGGLPLALELAAARVPMFGLEGVVARLAEQLQWLNRGARDAPSRQQTLRAALTWSHALLDTPQKAVFRRLAVFADSFTVEAAEVVCRAPEDGPWPVLDALQSLVDKSLVSVVRSSGPAFAGGAAAGGGAGAFDPSDPSDPFGPSDASEPSSPSDPSGPPDTLGPSDRSSRSEPSGPSDPFASLGAPAAPADGSPRRLRLLVTAREFALEHLSEAGEAEATRARHADAVHAIFERALIRICDTPLLRWLERLWPELPELRAALRWAAEASSRAEADAKAAAAAGNAPPGGPLEGRLGRSPIEPSKQRLVALVALAGAAGPFWNMAGLNREAQRWLDLVRPFIGEHTPALHAARYWQALALRAVDPLSSYAEAVAAAQRAEALYRQLGDTFGEYRMLGVQAINARRITPPLDVEPLLARLRALERPEWTAAWRSARLRAEGIALSRAGDWQGYRDHFAAERAGALAAHDEVRSWAAFINVAVADIALGRPERAAADLEPVVRRLRAAGYLRWQWRCAAVLMAARVEAGLWERARAAMRETLSLLTLAGAPDFIGDHLAWWATANGAPDEGATLLGWCDAAPARRKAHGRERHDEHACRKHELLLATLLPPERVAALRAAGCELDNEQAVLRLHAVLAALGAPGLTR
jgi:predicted ATPase/DNA-binding winged helix-turn-helix (wHTH) protein